MVVPFGDGVSSHLAAPLRRGFFADLPWRKSPQFFGACWNIALCSQLLGHSSRLPRTSTPKESGAGEPRALTPSRGSSFAPPSVAARPHPNFQPFRHRSFGVDPATGKPDPGTPP